MAGASLTQTLAWRAQAMAWDAYAGAFRAMGLDRASAAGAALLGALGPRTRYHHIAKVNLRRAFPDAADPEIARLLGAAWANFGRLAGENPHMAAFAGPRLHERVELAGAEIVRDVQAAGRPVVIVSAHLANWEVLGAVLDATVKDCRVAYRPANNPLITQRILAARGQTGLKTLAPKGAEGARELIQTLKDGGSLALMGDQKMNDGVSVPLFGHDAMTAPGPARLALRAGAPLIPLSIRRLDGAYFRAEFHGPIEPDASLDRAGQLLAMVRACNAWLEDRIREAPEQWFWMHRRWDKAVYREKRG